MSKRTKPPTWEPEIDQEYESRVTALDQVSGHVSDYAGQYQIEPVRPAMPTTWTPAQTPTQAQQAQRSATIGQLRQMVDEQGQEPQRVATGNRFVITEDTNAKDRTGAGLRWWLAACLSCLPLALGLGLWLFLGWGFFSFVFVFIGAGMVIGLALLNWQSIAQSPITVEKKQRQLDHEYRMYKEANAQRTREMIAGAFLGGAKQDLATHAPVVDGQLLLTDSRNGVRK